MIKKISVLLFLILTVTNSMAQKELWAIGGTNVSLPGPEYNGTLLKFDINVEHEQVIHNFNFPTGITPRGKLFLASNGKLYGTASAGGFTSSFLNEGAGVLFEYDFDFKPIRSHSLF